MSDGGWVLIRESYTDVVSLFTNVPVDLASQVASDRLQLDDSLGNRTLLSPDQICTLLKFCLNATFVAYKGVFYRQIQGTAMGSPVSVTVADLVMEDVEQRALSTFPDPPRFWKRYVDDTCIALKSDQVELAVVRTLFHRADTLSSSVEDQDHEKKHIIRALSRNGYPSRVILRSETGKKTQAQSGGDPPKATVVLPYIRNTSESIRRVLSTVNIRTCFKPHRTLSQVLVHTKDPVPQECRKAVVYRVPCGSCDMSYIGETGRTLQLRIKEHRRALTNGDPCMSALAEHAINNHHNIAVNGNNKKFTIRCALEQYSMCKHVIYIN